MSNIYECQVDIQDLRYAEDNLGEKCDNRDKSVNEIQVWLESTGEYLNARTDYMSILAFLRGCKFNVDKAKTKIENYYKLRTNAPEWFRERDPLLPKINELLDLGIFVPIKQRDQDGRMVIIARVTLHNPKISSINDVIKTDIMVLDVALRRMEEASIYGVAVILDMEGVSLSHAMQLSSAVISKIVHAWQNYHVRPKLLLFVNAPSYVNIVLDIFKQFMSEKLKRRVRVLYRNANTQIHEEITKDVLPVEYGGTNGNLKDLIEFWKQEVNGNRQFFLDDEKYKANI